MRNRTCYIVVIVLTIIMALSGGVPVMGAPGGGGGGGGGGGNEAPDYGDQVFLYRYSDGFPVPSAAVCPDDLGEECEASQAIGGLCLQPIASQEFEGCEYTDPALSGEEPVCLVPVDPVTCAPQAGYEYLLMEVEFGRINLVRSPEDVLEEQLQEALYSLTTAGCLSRDAAGRFVYSTLLSSDSELESHANSPAQSASKLVYDALLSVGEVESHAIDSPLQNLAIFWKIMKDGELDENIDIGETAYEVAMTAARGLGASSDKEGEINVDLLSYLNEILGFTQEGGNALFDFDCIEIRQEVKGVMAVVEKCYLVYDGFSYDRSSNFSSLPSPAYIPGDVPLDGYFEYLALDGSSLVVTQGPILGAVPELVAAPSLIADGIKGFVQAADDTRATIEFIHTWEVPETLATPVSCDTAAGDFFDVSISEYSGLQVPVRMIVDSEDREVIVTVHNAGPADASGTVVVYAVDIDAPENVYFSEEYTFENLPAGFNASWEDVVSVDRPLTLKWTAEAVTELEDGTNPDVNLSNNTVSEITRVISSGGGGGGPGH